MASAGKISIKEIERKLLLFLFYYTIFIQGLMSLLGLPQYMLYIKDAALVLCLLLNFYRHEFRIRKVEIGSLLPLILFVISIISALEGKVPFFTYFVAVRKLFRGFIYMDLCIKCLNQQDIEYTINACYKLQLINFALISIQRFVLGYNQDHSNGFFGTGLTNNYVSVLCITLVCYCTAEFYYKHCSLKKYIFQLALNFGIAAITELKVLFILLPIAIIFILREKIFSNRGMKISLFLIFGLVAALIVFGTMYADQLSSLISISGMKNYNNWGLATHALVDRKNWLSYTISNIFAGNFIKNVFGVGFGTVSGLSSSVSDAYGFKLLGYGSYSASLLLLELGFVGLILIVLWFFLNMRKAFTKSENDMQKIFLDFEKGFILSMFVFLIYANILYNDSSYLVFFALSFMYIKNNDIVRK